MSEAPSRNKKNLQNQDTPTSVSGVQELHRTIKKKDEAPTTQDLSRDHKRALATEELTKLISAKANSLKIHTEMQRLLKIYSPTLLIEALGNCGYRNAPEQTTCKKLEGELKKAEADASPETQLQKRLTKLLTISKGLDQKHFETIDFFEEAISVINDYDHDLVQLKVSEIATDPEYNEEARRILLDLAYRPRAERNDLLEARKKALRLGDHFTDHQIEDDGRKTDPDIRTNTFNHESITPSEPTRDTLVDIKKPNEVEEDLSKTLPRGKAAAKRESTPPGPLLKSPALAKTIEAKYGYHPEILIKDPSLARKDTEEKSSFGKRILGFFKQFTNNEEDPALTKALDAWAVAKIADDALTTLPQAESRYQAGYLGRRTSSPDVTSNMRGTNLERRGAMTTLGAYAEKDIETIQTTPEKLLKKVSDILNNVENYLDILEKEGVVVTQKQINGIASALAIATEEYDRQRPLLERSTRYTDVPEEQMTPFEKLGVNLSRIHQKFDALKEAQEGNLKHESERYTTLQKLAKMAVDIDAQTQKLLAKKSVTYKELESLRTQLREASLALKKHHADLYRDPNYEKIYLSIDADIKSFTEIKEKLKG